MCGQEVRSKSSKHAIDVSISCCFGESSSALVSQAATRPCTVPPCAGSTLALEYLKLLLTPAPSHRPAVPAQ